MDEQASSAEATSYQILKGLDSAIEKNVRIINMSFAGPRDPMMERMLKTAHDKGIILVPTAGNAGPKSPPLYPGADPSVVALTVTDCSEHGSAPGNTYQLTTGTLITAAHVSGVAPLLVERKPTITPRAVCNLLIYTAHAINMRGREELDGAGLVDRGRASQLLPPARPPPPAPRACTDCEY